MQNFNAHSQYLWKIDKDRLNLGAATDKVLVGGQEMDRYPYRVHKRVCMKFYELHTDCNIALSKMPLIINGTDSTQFYDFDIVR
jgi:hypothetical protein